MAARERRQANPAQPSAAIEPDALPVSVAVETAEEPDSPREAVPDEADSDADAVVAPDADAEAAIVPDGEAAPRIRAPRQRKRGLPIEVQRAQPRLIETLGPDPSTPLADVRLTVGVLIGVHGITGDLKLRLESDDPEHLMTVKRVYLDDEFQPRRVERMQLYAGNVLVKLAGIDTPEAGLVLRGRVVRIAGSDARPLPAGEFRLYQLIGLDVYDEAGAKLGRVVDLLETGANDVFVVMAEDGTGELLLPYIPDVVLTIDPPAHRMVVRPPVYYGE